MSNPQTVQDLFNVTREQWLEGARFTARRLLRNHPQITIEDVLDIYPRPRYLHRNTTGSVFKDDMFHHIGFTRARKLSSHGRVIGIWTMKDEYTHDLEADC